MRQRRFSCWSKNNLPSKFTVVRRSATPTPRINTIIMRVPILLIALLVFTTAFAEPDRTCQPTTGIRNSLCGNTTANTYAIPAKVCSYGPVDVSATGCVAQVFNTWQLQCPKRNLDLTSFCQGWGGFENIDYTYPCMVLQRCTTDADCKRTIPPQTPPPKKCYSCCQICYDNTNCAARVASGEYAAQGDTNCVACPYTATPHTLSPIPATPTAAPVAAPKSVTPTTAPVTPPVTAPKAPPVAAPVATPVTVPKAPPVATPVAAPVTAPKAPPVASPVAAPIAAPKAPPVSVPVTVPVNAPKAPPVAAPLTAPIAAPKATPIAAPVTVPVNAPKAPPVSSPIATPVAAPKATPVSVPVTAPKATPIASPVAVPVTAPVTSIPLAPKGTPITTTTTVPDASASNAKLFSAASHTKSIFALVLALMLAIAP